MSDFFQGMGHGILGLFGAGSLVDPLGKLKSELSNQIQDFNNMTADFLVQISRQEVTVVGDLAKLVQGSQELQDTKMDQMSQMLWDSIETESLFILIMYGLIFIVIIYLIIKK